MKTWLACLFVFVAAAPLSAQQPDPARRRADFLFGRPKAAIALRGSWIFARAGSDLFDFVTEHLTLDKEDFNVPAIAADLAIAITPRLDAQVGFEMSRMHASSEYRDLVDNLFLPIEQQTRLKTIHLVGGVRYALAPKGYEVSRLAWVPRRVIPFVGAGVGAVVYEFDQTGDFVDFVDLSVFSDTFRSQGWAPTAHAFGGVDIQMYRGLYATVEGRYTKAAGKLGSDFIDFDPIDLSGFRMSAGINVVF
jgi:hypothetical protein